MKTNTLIRKDYMHVVVCLAMSVLSVGNALGGVFSSAKPNPEYIKWQKRRHSVPVQNTPASTHPKTRLLAASGEDEVFNPRFTEGVEPSYIDFSYLNAINNRDVMGVADPLPRRHDPRDDYTLTPVRQQDPQDTGIGTCWAQASVGSMETWLAVNGLGQHQFSVKNMVNLIGYDRGTDASKPRGWFGGNAIKAAAYLLRWGGPVWESNDPYTNKYGVLNYSLVSDEFQPQYHVQQMRIVPARTGALDNEALKRAILEFGGLYATMKLYTPYYTYKGNTYLVPYWNANGAYYCPETGAGHAVTLVGWDDDYPKENFNPEYRPKGNGAFIVKDSYGTETPRDNGYIYVSYYDTTFAYSESYAFPQLEETDNYAAIYQYDTLGLVDSYVSLSSAYAANIFTAKADCLLDAVGFYAVVPNEPYTLSVYVGCKAGNPTDGEVKVEQSGVTDSYAGYYTVKLDEPMSVRKGQRFSIVMKLTSSKLYPIPVEMAYEDYSSEATASAGQSFVRINPTDSWLDMTEVIHGTANFCCKAYTKSATAAKPTLLSITVKPEDGKTASIKSGDSVQMKCEAMYSNNSKSNVTDGVNWSLTSGRDYATLSSRGLLTAKNIAVLEPQTVTVQAVYAENGIVVTNKFGFSMAATPPVAPMEVSATQGADSSCVRVSWAAPVGATEYAVYRATANNNKNAQHLENVTIARYNDTKAVPGTDYWYFVKAKNSSGTSGFSGSANGWRKLAPPDNATATDNLLDKVTLEWSEVEGATHYRVYRAESMDSEKTALGNWQTARAFDDTTATAGVTYYYFVVAAVDANGSRPSDYSIVEDGRKAVPVTVDHLEINGDASITSGGYADYTADAIYTDGHKVADVSPVTWTLSGNVATLSGNRVAAATVTANSSVTLSATYTVDGKNAGGTKEIAIVATKPPRPTGLAITSQSTAGIVLGWQTAAGASSYNVYRDSSPIGSASGMTFADNTATPGVTYSYSITAVNSAGESAMSGAVSAMIPLSAPMGVKASHDNATAVMLSWTGVNGATHYRVARAANATGTKTELGTWQSATTFADTTAEPGIEYVYFVKAATDAGATVTSEWSEGVKGKILYEAPTLQALVIGGPDRIAASGTGTYSCTAVFSDDTKNIVTPAWAISSTAAATINPSGEVTAKAVSADAKVTITASYGGIQASRQIVIVAPLETASATVSDVSVAPRWPFGTKVDIDYTLDTTPAGIRALVTLSGYDNDHQKEMPATTITGDSANQAVLAGRHRLTWDVGADYPGFHAKSFDVNVKAEPYVIPSVTGIQTGETTTRGVALSWNGIENATAYEVWRSTSMSVDNATNVFSVTNVTECLDSSATPGTIYFYWLKTVTPYGTGDFSSEYAFGYRQKVSVAVTFEPNGGTLSGASPVSYTAGDQYKNLPLPTRTGYDFAGWWTLASGGVQIDMTSVVDENITTLYANWTPHTYTIHFDPNGGTGSMSDMMMTYDVTTSLTANAFVKDGWTFIGWATSIGGGVEHVERESISNLSSDDGVTIMLYAVWEQMPTWVITDGVLESVFLNGVRDVEIPSNVSSIGEKVFSECYDLETVIIPTSVTNISDRAFDNCTGLKSAIVPNSVERIGKYAFYGCKELGTVNIPTKVKMIEWCAFDNCSSLTDVIIPNGVTNIQAHAFYRCNLKNINVPKSVLHIGTYAFAYCEELEYLSLSEGIQSVDSRAFEGCSSLKSVTLPNSLCKVSERMFSSCHNLANVVIGTGVTSIGDGAFSGCGLTSLSIPENVKTIGASAFAYCDGLKTVTMSKGVTTIENTTYNNLFDNCANLENINVDINNSSFTSVSGVLYNKDKTRLIRVPEGKAISQFTVPSSVEIIQNGAFRNCNKITKVIMQSGVRSIDNSVFNNASQLRTITIPSSVTQIGNEAFSYCSNLTAINVDDANSRFASDGGVLYNKSKTTVMACPGGSTYVVIPNGVTTIASSAFCGCSKLTGVSIPTSVINIANYAFRDCSALTDFSWPKTVERIRGGVFLGCNSLRTITIPNTVMGIDLNAFQNCSNLIEITVPNSVKYINSDAFKNCVSLSNLTLGTGITSIGSSAFEGCRSLKQVTIPKNVESIGYRAFQGCDNLYRAIIGCRSIGAAFYGCRNLVNVVINDGVENIGSSTFADCVRLTDITLPMSVTNINATAFSACESLTNINVSSANIMYSTTHGMLYNKDKTELLLCPAGLSDFDMENSVTKICDRAFAYCDKVSRLVIPSGVVNIGNCAFYACTNLVDVTMPSTVKTIGNNAFERCSSMTSITIPSSVTRIGEGAFRMCSKLQSVNFLGALETYITSDEMYGKTPLDLKIYVTPIWSGPIDIWCRRKVVVVQD